MEVAPSPELHIEFCYSPLPPADVRWYSYRASFDVKELSKATEVPHRGSLLRFCQADSSALEAAYRLRHEELECCWWAEEAALQKGDGDGGDSGGGGRAGGAGVVVGGNRDADPSAGCDSWAYFMGGCADQEPGVPVRSGAFEVELRSRCLRPCYWPASRHRVLRGTWFVEKGGEWVPLKESLAEQIEEGYRQAIWLPTRGRLQAQAGGGYGSRLDLTTHVERGLYALFMSEDEAFLCQETGWGWLRKIGASSTAGQQRLRLRRGYAQPGSKALLEKEADLRQEELDEACAAAPVSRLVLVVHGIGQTLAQANIAQDAGSFRSVLRQVAQDQAQQGLMDEAATGRTEVLPVQWRKQLSIEADKLSRQLMPPGIPSLRQVLHSTVVEILLFMTPAHRAEIVNSLVTSLNATYSRFMARNPGFDGTVSILAHSLGSVLCFDILCNQASPAAPSSPGDALTGTPPRPEPSIEDSMVIDLTADSPSAALQQEVARLRAENQLLQLQLELAGAPAGRPSMLAGIGSMGSGLGGSKGGSMGGSMGGMGSMGGVGSFQQPSLPRSASGVGLAAAGGAQAGAAPPPLQQQQQSGLAGSADVKGGEPWTWAPLQFSVDQLILLGSPLGCFLALRGVNQARGLGLGMPASAPLMQLAPGHPYTNDGLPAVRRLHNVYHPYDPVAHRLDLLAHPPSLLPRPAFVPLFKGGKRIHLAVQEFSEDVGSAASRFGSSLLSSLAFAKFRSSAAHLAAADKAASEAAGGAGTDKEGGMVAAEAAQAAAEAAAEEAAARRLPKEKSAAGALSVEPCSMSFDEGLGGASSSAVVLSAEGSRLQGVLSFGAVDAMEAADAAAAALAAAGGSGGGGGASSAEGGARSAIARVADGEPLPGSKTAQGRLDFVMQESSLENQYLSALSAHFGYWTSADVALFVLRAVHDMDVLTGVPRQQQEQQEEGAAVVAQEAAGVAAEGGGGGRRQRQGAGRQVEPTSPRQHLLILP